MPRFRLARTVKKAPSPAVKTWLSQADGIETLWPSLERHSALQADVDLFCCEQHCGQAFAREHLASELILLARSPSQAAKLRNLQSSLLNHLTQRGWHCTRIIVRVQSERYLGKSVTNPVHKSGIPRNSLADWQRLHSELPAGTLKDAITQLLQRRQG